jgi:hypothetical protein
MDSNGLDKDLLQRHIKDCESRIDVIKKAIQGNMVSETDTCKENIKTLNVAIEALGRQVQKKPVKRSFIIPSEGIDVCPNCKKPLQNKWNQYCHKCGQKLDWGDE